MIRISSGRFRGRVLEVPHRADKALRPTSVKCRAAIFNILAHTFHVDWETTHILDLFAGTGALGFEALSRGGASITFIESHGPTAKALAKTCQTLGVEECTQVITWAVAQGAGSLKSYLPKPLATYKNPFSLIFCDPPYATPTLSLEAIALLKAANLLAPKALLVLEISRTTPHDTLCPPGFTFCFSRVYGDTRVLFAQAHAH
jgi:16S rRNA (guanine966-N2)-methyltransferase